MISPYKEKFFSEVKTVTLQYAPMAFNVNVNSVVKTNWTHYCSATIGSLSGYKVAYVIEEVNSSNQTVSTATVNSGTPTSNTNVSGKKEGNQGVQYKVWATAIWKANEQHRVKSTNYVLVQTSHPSHYGNTSSGGDCYKNYTTCTNDTYYIEVGGASHPDGWYSVKSTNQKCVICGNHTSAMYRAQKGNTNSQGMMTRIYCAVCGAHTVNTSRSDTATFACSSHNSGWSYGSLNMIINGVVIDYTNVLKTGPVAWGGKVYNCYNGASYYVSHNRIYSLTCSGLVNASATSVNF